MRYLILKAGRAPRITRERLGDFDTMFRHLLSEPGQVWDVCDVEHGEFPPSLRGYGGVVITGSPASAYDDSDWVRRLLELVRSGYEAGTPMLGICFGLQAVAQALGGKVMPSPEGWEIGLTELSHTEAGMAFTPLAAGPQPLRILEVHQDIAAEPPPGAVVLSSSRRTVCEIFRLGDRVLCLQGHPEMDNEAIRELIEIRERKGLLDADRAREGLESLQTPPHREFLQSWLRHFMREGRLPVAA